LAMKIGYASFLRAQVMWFQLLRYLEQLLGVSLTTSTEIDLLKNGPRVLEYPDDVDSASIGDVLEGVRFFLFWFCFFLW
jgi:hypothetical protein